MILSDRFYNDDSHWSSRLLILYSHVLKKRGHLAAASMMNSVIGLLVPDHVKLKEWFNHPKKFLPLFRLLTLSCFSKPVCFNFSVLQLQIIENLFSFFKFSNYSCRLHAQKLMYNELMHNDRSYEVIQELCVRTRARFKLLFIEKNCYRISFHQNS